MTADILDVLTRALQHSEQNVIHFVSTPQQGVDITLTSSILVARGEDGTTTCGRRIGGMLYGDLTRAPNQVTCEACLRSKRFPLDELGVTEL